MGILNYLNQVKIIAVLRAKDAHQGYKIANAMIEGGIKAIEITFTIPGAEELIKKLNERYGDAIYLGAGTVLDLQTCKKAIQNGAKYIVSPGFERACAEYCYETNVPYLPGCMTVTEMMNALSYHVDVIKLFPGEHFGPSFIKSIKAPLPNLKIMVTGGVDLDNLEEWFKAGADMVGIGSALTKHQEYNQIVEVAKAYVNKVKAVNA